MKSVQSREHQKLFSKRAMRTTCDHAFMKEKDMLPESEEKFPTSSIPDGYDNHIVVQEIRGCRCKYDVLSLKKRNLILEKEIKKLNKHLEKNEAQKLEQVNLCNMLESKIVSCAGDKSSIKKLRTELLVTHQKKAEVEAEFMNQLNTLCMIMRQKEITHDAILGEKEDRIFFLETKLAEYENMKTPKSMNDCVNDKISDGARVIDTDENPQDEGIVCSLQDKKTIDYLSTSLKQSRSKNMTLSKEIKILQALVSQLDLKASKVSRMESELEESRTKMNSFRRAHLLLDQLDSSHEKELQKDLLNASQEEEEFMNQLQSLEMDMNAEIKNLESELTGNAIDAVEAE